MNHFEQAAGLFQNRSLSISQITNSHEQQLVKGYRAFVIVCRAVFNRLYNKSFTLLLNCRFSSKVTLTAHEKILATIQKQV